MAQSIHTGVSLLQYTFLNNCITLNVCSTFVAFNFHLQRHQKSPRGGATVFEKDEVDYCKFVSYDEKDRVLHNDLRQTMEASSNVYFVRCTMIVMKNQSSFQLTFSCFSLEEELRTIDPNVSLPYWDYTMDYYVTKPSESVIWTPCLLGCAEEVIKGGPFDGWYGGHNLPIARYAGHSSGACPPKIISNHDIDDLMKYCRFKVSK